MATVIESFVSKYLVEKLVAFTKDRVVMVLGVKDGLNKLERKIRRIAAYLKDAERRRITDESVNKWLNELKDVMYDFDDMIDQWIYKSQSLSSDEPSSLSNSSTCCPFPLFSSFRSIYLRDQVAQQIKTLNDKLEEIFKDMANLTLQHIQSEVGEVCRVEVPVSSPVVEVDIIGNEIVLNANKLVKMAVANNKEKFNLVAITGMGGIGKTTLAQKMYNDTSINNRYSNKMWLSVTQIYSLSQLIKEAIRNAGGDPGNAERESELLPIIADVIHEKSFFLVLDDVWNPNSVNSLLNAVKSSATYGFILVTTRDQRVAMRMGAKYIHQMEVLSPKSAWELLRKKSYLTDISDIQHLQDIGTKIVQKCGGLPLAVIAIAGILATKNKNKNEWENVLKNSVWSIRGLPEEIDRALYLSYEDLSPQLKQCFLYCSLYPPNYVMFREDLVKFWIAEGFVEQKSGPIIEKTAEEYYDELIRRNLLEPERDITDYSQCKMHDLFRSLAQYLSKEEIFSGDKVFLDHNVISRIRRLSINEVNEQTSIPVPVTKQSKLRTFLIFNCLSKIKSHNFTRFKNLRVLHVNEKGLHNVPESIGNLIHLRMLDLDRTSISNLPESIGSLTNLLFLYLSSCELLHTLPRGITRVCNLRHLQLEATPLTSVPKGLGVLTNLTKIYGFQVGGDGSHDEVQNGWDLQELEGLFQLRRIRINRLERARNVSTVFANKNHLKELYLKFSDELERESGHEKKSEHEKNIEIVEKLCPPTCLEKLVIKNYRGKMLPSWMSLSSLGNELPNLLYLILDGWSCCLDLPPLGVLPNLRYIKLTGISSIVRISLDFLGINVQNGLNLPVAFPKLEYFIFKDMPNWEEWKLSSFEGEDSKFWQLMPRIKKLTIHNCPKLRALPDGLLAFECNLLGLYNNKCLEVLSNLPGVKKLTVIETPNLRIVGKLDSVEHIILGDYEMERLPEWLVKFMEGQNNHLENKVHLDLYCKTSLLERCVKDGPDWHIIKSFFSVSVYNKERNTSLQYTREPESYFSSL